MDFEENDNGEEEMDIPAYHPPPGNSGRPKQGGAPDLPAGNFPRHSVGGVRYRECLKNHAVGIGGHAVDGCGEFTAAGEEGTIDALRCAACNCHRNFHRKDLEPGGGGDRSGFHSPYSPYYRMPVGYLQYNQMGAAAAAGQQRFVAHLGLPSTSGGGLSREEHEEVRGGGGGGLGASSSSSGKKRFRTKFTPEQKNKMLAFADRIGWRIQKSDEAEVQQFCEETSIKRHVFKVWMHNNKHTIGKQAIDPSPPPLPLPSESIGH
ncbi:zinc-finger homeodomain protein 1-like [Phalaenopsis equestris]|uniref:zinc-finger homeodomain protein 1-like n=1 Tax=Phalaenopsis equestris TaxID=78828 RepID=UPI0009E2C7BC|nr:zinc-finger homeodomain protein 1-like [Phalaenopsis equestris]